VVEQRVDLWYDWRVHLEHETVGLMDMSEMDIDESSPNDGTVALEHEM
jgi:hypothetical protein